MVKMKDSKMPVLFIGHGSPMNAIEKNPFSNTIVRLGKKILQPKAILVISAHWLTARCWITHANHPETIHDFHNFPQELYDVRYPAPGAPELAEDIKNRIERPIILLDEYRGFDHGVWSVLMNMYPEANIPVIQLSIDMSQPPEFHFELGTQLKSLRKEGILIIGSGNIVHNIPKMIWDPKAEPYSWAIEFNERAKQYMEQRDFKPLMNELLYTPIGRLSVPVLDHYMPLLYSLGASDNEDALCFEYDNIELCSISMLTLSLGLTG